MPIVDATGIDYTLQAVEKFCCGRVDIDLRACLPTDIGAFGRSLRKLSFVLLVVAVLGGVGCGGSTSAGNSIPAGWLDVINVRNPVTLPGKLAAQRVPVGIAGDYKPDLVLLPNGELLLVMFIPITNANGTYQENMILYRSPDGGETWGARETLPLLGREPYFSILGDGTLFITASFVVEDFRNIQGYAYAIVYRSTNGGITWSTQPIYAEDVPGAPAKSVTRTSRNILELNDALRAPRPPVPRRPEMSSTP